MQNSINVEQMSCTRMLNTQRHLPGSAYKVPAAAPPIKVFRSSSTPRDFSVIIEQAQ